MDCPTETISDRWRLFRRAREAGAAEVEAYDRYLHPRSRITDAQLAEELGEPSGADQRSEGAGVS